MGVPSEGMARWLCAPPLHCCDLLSHHYDLPVSHTCGGRCTSEVLRAFDGCMLCFSTSFCKLQGISVQILGLFFRGDWLAALVWVSTQQHHTLMWILRDQGRHCLSKRIQTVGIFFFSPGRGKFSKSASVYAPSNTVLNGKMTSWWALPAGVPSESCRKHCVL